MHSSFDDAYMLPGSDRAEDRGAALFVDVETTGLSPNFHEVVELGAVLFHFSRSTGSIIGITDEYTGLREPSRPIPPDAAAIHGITMDMVRGRRLDFARIQTLWHEAEFIVAHNATFDYGFITRLIPETAAKPWLCSMRQINWNQHGYRTRRLQRLLASHGIEVEAAHRAGDDCRGAVNLLNCTCPAGHTYFAELLQNLHSPVRSPRQPGA